MVEIDSDTYQIKTMRVDNKAAQPRFLITPERSQNLELLQHLLTNTHQAIVLCGPEGVGKTALLQVLRKRLNDEWRCCVVNGHDEMTFDEVHERVGPFLRQHRSEASIKNTRQGGSPDSHKNVVLIIDDAGEMAPGLLTRLIQLAENYQELRLLFVVTHDQWHIKNYSEPAIENCYLVEAKPLLQKECRDFVQHIASLTNSLKLGKGLTDEMIDAVYRESHGIPARIIAHFPELNKPRGGRDPLTVLMVAVAFLVSLALYMQWHTASRPVGQMTTETVLPSSTKAHFDLSQPVLSLPVGDILKYAQDPNLPRVQQEGLADVDKTGQAVVGAPPELSPAAASIPAPSEQNNQAMAVGQPKSFPDAVVSPAPSQEPAMQAGAGDDAESWLTARPENSYSLQLMVLSKASTVDTLIARHSELQPDLRVVRRIWKGKEKFVLLYGEFADAESAKTVKKSLPAEFKSAMIRKFGAIRKEFPFTPNP